MLTSMMIRIHLSGFAEMNLAEEESGNLDEDPTVFGQGVTTPFSFNEMPLTNLQVSGAVMLGKSFGLRPIVRGGQPKDRPIVHTLKSEGAC